MFRTLFLKRTSLVCFGDPSVQSACRLVVSAGLQCLCCTVQCSREVDLRRHPDLRESLDREVGPTATAWGPPLAWERTRGRRPTIT